MKKKLFLLLPFIIVSCSYNDDSLITNDKVEPKHHSNYKNENKFVLNEKLNSDNFYQNSNDLNQVAKVINIYEGDFIRIESGIPNSYFYVWIYRGTLRHIASHDTWVGLFNNNKSFKATFSSWQHAVSVTNRPMGYTLHPDNDLIRDPLTQKIYLREGSSIVWIKNLNTFNYYKFNPNAIKNIPGGIIENGPGAVYSYGGYIDILN